MSPLRMKTVATALRARMTVRGLDHALGHRCWAALGGAASSQAWKPIRASWLIASSTSPALEVQRITTWSG